MSDYEDYLHRQYGPDLDGEADQPVDYCDRVDGVTHIAADHDACERRRIDALKAKPPTMTVSGNGITVFRLDEQGNPIGEGLSLDTAVSLNIHPNPDEDIVIEGWDRIRNTYTLDMCLQDMSPELLAILTGGALKPRPWWYRWLPRFLKRRLKSRWIRRGYGG